MTRYRAILGVLLLVGLLWLSTSLLLAQAGFSRGRMVGASDPPPDPTAVVGERPDIEGRTRDPTAVVNEHPCIESRALRVADQAVAGGPVNPRHYHVTLDTWVMNHGPGELIRVNVYHAVPPNRPYQHISNLSLSSPCTLITDRYGQEVSYCQVDNLSVGEQVTVSWELDVEIEAMNYGVDPGQVTGLDQIPPDIVDTYTRNEFNYHLESRIIQDAAQAAVDGATNPYWIARNIHDFVADHLYYSWDSGWQDAETVYLEGRGRCTEYTWLYIALCRANGLPARYIGGTLVGAGYTGHRRAEVYLPPYGWVPVDVTWDDSAGGHGYFGAVSGTLFVTTMGGGGSELLEWTYINLYRFFPTTNTLARSTDFRWTRYPSELRVSPPALTGSVPPGSTDAIVGDLDIISTNGSYDWSLGSADAWLRLSKDSGSTPERIQVIADTTGFDLGTYTGQVTIQSNALGQSVTVPVEVLVEPATQPAIDVTKQAYPDPVRAGSPLTYTLCVTNTGNVTLTLTAVTDTLPAHVTPGGTLTWTPSLTLTPDGVWTERFTVTVDRGYSGTLTNVVHVDPDPGATGIYTKTSTAIVTRSVYLPLVMRDR